MLQHKMRKLSMKSGKEMVKRNGIFMTYSVEIW